LTDINRFIILAELYGKRIIIVLILVITGFGTWYVLSKTLLINLK
jgi:hypothetical protein